MRVLSTQPFKLIYSITDEEYIGTVIEPHVVQLSSNGQLSLTHQRLFNQTAPNFEEGLTENDIKAIACLDEISPEALFKKFRDIALVPKKTVKSIDFYRKYFNEQLHQLYIRPFIEKKINEALLYIDTTRVYSAGKDGNPAHKELLVEQTPATVLFHFRRNIEGTRYFATIKHGESRVDYMKTCTRILSNNPAWLMADSKLFCFDEGVEAKRFSPFLKQKWIEVKPQSEEKYFKTFVVPLLEKFDVYAEGFQIVNEKVHASPVISIQQWNDKYYLAIGFTYADQYFNFNNSKKIHVKITQQQGEFTFHKIKRSAAWEKSKVESIERLQLKLYEGSLYYFKNADLYNTIEWINNNKNTLIDLGFKIEQQLSKKYFIGSQNIEIDFKANNDWFDLTIVVKFGEFNIPFIDLKKYITSNQREFSLPNGDIAIIPEAWFARYYSLFENGEQDKNKLKLKKYHVGILQALWSSTDLKNNIWEEKLKKFVEPKEEPIPIDFKADLRKYQKEGYDWMYFLKNNHFGGILADDMGLGKTIQTLCLLQNELELKNKKKNASIPSKLIYQTPKPDQLNIFSEINKEKDSNLLSDKEYINIPNPSLLIVPTSLVFNWKSEAQKFAPNLKTYIYIGTNRIKDLTFFYEYDLIITTYGILRSDADLFKDHNFNYIILDESQAAKNPSSVTAKALLKLRANFKLALTGTPVENSVNDIWTQMNFVNPGLLGSLQYFQDTYVNPIEKEHNQEKAVKLQQILNPFILRRKKEMVATDLPEKTEYIRYCEMDPVQKDYYEEIKSFYRNEILKTIEEDSFSKNKLSVLQGLTKLRLIANHPKLNDSSYEGGSTKFHDVVHMAKSILSQGHKIIIFSQFVKHLDIYKQYFNENEIPFEYLDGSSSASERSNSVNNFQQNKSINIFLISLKAGGFGLNLTAADYVFLLDPWWNPAIEKQAQDRSHRIGQDKNVFIYKFITKDTIEEKILALQDKKSRLAESIIHAEETLIKKINPNELLELLS